MKTAILILFQIASAITTNNAALNPQPCVPRPSLTDSSWWAVVNSPRDNPQFYPDPVICRNVIGSSDPTTDPWAWMCRYDMGTLVLEDCAIRWFQTQPLVSQ